jgi:hypothetical protein
MYEELSDVSICTERELDTQICASLVQQADGFGGECIPGMLVQRAFPFRINLRIC